MHTQNHFTHNEVLGYLILATKKYIGRQSILYKNYWLNIQYYAVAYLICKVICNFRQIFSAMSRKKVFSLFIISIIIFVVTSISVTWYTHDIFKEDRKIIEVAEVFTSLDELRINLRALITSHSYFMLTSKDDYLVDYFYFKEELRVSLENFRKTDYRLFMSKAQGDSLEMLINQETQLMDEILVFYKHNDKKAATQLVVSKVYPLLKVIRNLAEGHSTKLELIQKSFKSKIERDIRSMIVTLIVGFSIGLLIILYVFTQLLLENRARRRSEKEILQYSEELKRINWSKDMFFSIIAHDLRSPFVSLLNLFELLNEAFSKKDFSLIEENIFAIEFSARRTYNLLQNLLEWSKLQTGRVKVTPEYFNMKDNITENIELYCEAARQKSISVNYSGQDLMVFADKNMIGTVLRNLLGNAIKFTESGKITIESEKHDDSIILKVIDTGIGLSREDIGKLFKIEVDTTSIGSSSEKGSGLGLILCKNFVELNGGRIWAESNPDEGSRFCFTIPIRMK